MRANATLIVNNSTVSDNTGFFGGGVSNFAGGFGASAIAMLSNSTVSGNTGHEGGVRNDAHYYGTSAVLTLDNCIVSGNSVGHGVINTAFRGSATATLNNSTISGNSGGGGVENEGHLGFATLTLSNSTVSGNSAAGNGGGVLNYSYNGTIALTLSNSTVSGNTAGDDGGGIANSAGEGVTATLTLSNSTVSGNTAAGNGGGVANYAFYTGGAVMSLIRSLISGNSASSGAEVGGSTNYGGSATFTANNANLLGHNSLTNAQAFSNFNPGVTDITATSDGTVPTALSAILNPPLANNGGPTLTHLLVTGSPAVDASPFDADCPATDQRSVSRPQGAACDIGAIEGHGSGGSDTDTDGDGVPDTTDNCPTVSNPEQTDTDLRGSNGLVKLHPDRLGDACDPDDDDDKTADAQDNCPLISNKSQKDSNGDGLGDACTYDLAIVELNVVRSTFEDQIGSDTVTEVEIVIQNQSGHAENLGSGSVRDLITVHGEYLGGGDSDCRGSDLIDDVTIRLNTGKKGLKSLSKIGSKGKLHVPYLIDNGQLCKGTYRFTATLDRQAADGKPDHDPADDVCPRIAGRVDPNPDGKRLDEGCGRRILKKVYVGEEILMGVGRLPD